MKDIILNYIIQAILGGASGYITNDYAINMLFKEYTPLKIGGVIKKTRHEFIENLSSLVENDLIKKDRLSEILLDEKFVDKFELLAEDFFGRSLSDAAGDDTVADIGGADSSLKTLRDFIGEGLDLHSGEIINLLTENLDGGIFLTDSQLNFVSEKLYSSFMEMLKCTDITGEILSSLYSSIGGINLYREIKPFADAAIDSAGTSVAGSLDEEGLDFLYEKSGLRDGLRGAGEIFKERKLGSIVNFDKESAEKISRSFLGYINSEKGKDTIEEICGSLIRYGKNLSFTLFQVMDASFEINLKTYLAENLPRVTDNLLEWVDANSKNIDRIIEESIDEVIRESDGFKGKLLATIKNSYFSNLTEKYKLVEKIKDYIVKLTEPERLGSVISSKIIEAMDTISIGKIVSEIEDSGAIDAQSATSFIMRYLNANSEKASEFLTDYLLDLKVKDVLPRGLSISIKDKVPYVLSAVSRSSLKKRLDRNLDELVSEGKLRSFDKQLIGYMSSNAAGIKDSLKSAVMSYKDDLNIKTSPDYQDILKTEALKRYDKLIADIRDTKLSYAVEKINSIDSLYRNSSDSIRRYAVNNIDSILKGSIKGIVSSNLNKLSDDELVNFANDFIGRELKPIMYFGAVLGTAAGIGLAAFQNGPLDPAAVKFSNMATYSVVGYATNAIAINMIFKPYRENKFLSRIPFFRNFALGYIVKNQKVFAENTAYFVDKKLLSRESINELFDIYEEKIKDIIVGSISANSYGVLNSLLLRNEDSLISGAIGYTKKSVLNNSSRMNIFVCDWLGNLKITSLLNDKSIIDLSTLGSRKLSSSSDAISKKIFAVLKSDMTTGSILAGNSSEEIKSSLSDTLGKYYGKLASLTEKEKAEKFAARYSGKYRDYTDRTLKEIIGIERLESLSNSSSKKIADIILSGSSRDKMADAAAKMLASVVEGDKTVEELFNGKLKSTIEDNIPSIFEKLTRMVKKTIEDSKGAITITFRGKLRTICTSLKRACIC
jgi:uncharacterized membrane protein YheB (UPF0754 family)